MVLNNHSLVRFALLIAFFVAPVYAQLEEPKFDFYMRGPYRENVPRPQRTLKFDTGEFHTNYALMERVIGRIAQAAPDRVRVTDIGETNEYRTMHLIAISSPENIGRLDAIKANIARLSDPRTLQPAEAQRLINETPLVAWMSYTIHGNESASFEAMMQVVYQLAASNETQTLDILQNAVVLINVCSNPDGHERFVTWYNSVATGNPDPLAGEHREPWSVSGRTNRYRFDLNRDNIASTQIETRNMQRAYLEWKPQVFVDHHGQTSQYFFPPAAAPINPNLPTEPTARWLTQFGRANASAFDGRGWEYYVRDVFDLFYPGYWDSWPSLNGATGMTYETDGGGTKGLAWRRDDDTIVTFRSAIAKHYVASMTTLETASRNARARLNDYYEFRRSAIQEGQTEQMRRIVLLPGADPGRAAEIADILIRAGIEVSRANAPFRQARAHSYTGTAATSAREFPAGSYVIDLAQPQKRLAKALLEPETNQDGSFVREQLARFARNERRGRSASKEEYGFYDITAWSLPHALGVEAYWTEDSSAITVTPLQAASSTLAEPSNAEAGSNTPISSRLTIGVSSSLQPPPLPGPPGSVSARAGVAYIIPYNRNGAAALACRLQREGFHLAVATRALNAGGRDYPRGTIVARVSRNSPELHNAIVRLARDTGVDVTAVNTAFTETGETGIGSEAVVSLKRPRIIVIADEPVSQTSYGAIWWTFDRYGVDFTPMRIDALRLAKLDRYNVIILPDGSPSAYSSAFGKAGVDSLRGWCERGGTLVCIKGAAVFAALKDINLTSARLVGSDDDDQKEPSAGSTEQPSTSTSSATPSTQASTGANAAANMREQTGEPTPRSRAQMRQTGTEQQRIQNEQTEKLEGAPPVLPPIASPSARPGRVPEAVPGAIFRATIDRTTPLTYGYEDSELAVLIDSAYFFRPSKEGTNALVFNSEGSETLHLAGFIWPNNTERLLRGTAYMLEEPMGRGHVVLYAEDPNFRGIWRTTTRLFFNSFLFQPTF